MLKKFLTLFRDIPLSLEITHARTLLARNILKNELALIELKGQLTTQRAQLTHLEKQNAPPFSSPLPLVPEHASQSNNGSHLNKPLFRRI